MKKLLAVFMLFFSVNLMAEPMVGADYNPTAQNVATDNPAKIEVAELFWYGCPHCHTLDPHLAAWVKKLPQDVYFKRVPGLPRPDWAPMAKAYYTMETLGVLEKLHVKLFEAVHTKRALKPDDEPAILDWITKESGMDRKKVNEAFNSFSNNTKLNRAAQFFRASGATGVPSLVIDGSTLHPAPWLAVTCRHSRWLIT